MRQTRDLAARRLLAGAALGLALHALATLLRAGVQLLLARWLGAEEFGAYVYLGAWSAVLATAAALGLPLAALRLVPRYDEESPGLVSAFVRFAAARAVACGLVLGGAAALALSMGGAPDVAGGAPWLLVAVPALAVLALLTEVSRARLNLLLALGPPHLLAPAATAVGAAALWAVDVERAAWAAFGAFAVAQALAATLQARAVRGALDPSPVPVGAATRRRWLRSGLPLLVSSLGALVLSTGDVIVVGLLLGPAEAGVYAVAVRLAYLAGLPLLGISAIAVPMLARAHVAVDHRAMQRVARQSARLSVAAALGATVVLALLASPALRLFGEGFEHGTAALRVVLVGQVIQSATGPVEQVLAATGHGTAAALPFLGGAVLLFALVGLGARVAGIEGAALGSAAALAGWNAWMALTVHRRVGIRMLPA